MIPERIALQSMYAHTRCRLRSLILVDHESKREVAPDSAGSRTATDHHLLIYVSSFLVNDDGWTTCGRLSVVLNELLPCLALHEPHGQAHEQHTHQLMNDSGCWVSKSLRSPLHFLLCIMFLLLLSSSQDSDISYHGPENWTKDFPLDSN